MMKILIADKLAPEGASFLTSQSGVEVTVAPGLTEKELVEALRGHHGVVVRSAVKLRAPLLDACMNGGTGALRAIARAGVGVDNIDLDAATRHGIAVLNSASATTITTAEHAFALLIALARNIAHAHMTMAQGGWDRNRFTGAQLHGKTLGIVGFGRIGRAVATRAQAFGMNVIGFDPFINAEFALNDTVKLVSSFDELIEQVDAVSFHVPKTEATAGMLGREQFAKARPGLLVVNAARGGIVDEDALLEALEAERCTAAALDVYSKEPLDEGSPLRNHPKILLTPHLGASTIEAQEAVAVDACRALLGYLRGEAVEGTVNLGRLSLDLSDRQRGFVELGSRMIALLNAVTGDLQPGTVRTVLRGESLASRADTIARYVLADLLQHHLDQPVNVVNAALIAEQRHIDTATVIAADTGEDRIAIELVGRDEGEERTIRVEGAIFADGRPRITNLDGYAMDMVPAGHMVLIINEDQPGRIGLVGQIFGDANVNIAEMVIGRKPTGEDGRVAMMILKLDAEPTKELLHALRSAPGIRMVQTVALPTS